MRLTIIPSDNAVYKDGIMRSPDSVPLNLTTCNIPSNVHAVQWKETYGWIEFTEDEIGETPPTEKISVLPEWALACVDVYDSWTPYVPPAPAPTDPAEQPTTSGTLPA